jgi:hypothetical protein
VQWSAPGAEHEAHDAWQQAPLALRSDPEAQAVQLSREPALHSAQEASHGSHPLQLLLYCPGGQSRQSCAEVCPSRHSPQLAWQQEAPRSASDVAALQEVQEPASLHVAQLDWQGWHCALPLYKSK